MVFIFKILSLPRYEGEICLNLQFLLIQLVMQPVVEEIYQIHSTDMLLDCVVDYPIVCYEASLHLYNYIACSFIFYTYKQFKFVTYDHPCIYFIVDASK